MKRLPELAALLENPIAAASVLGAVVPGQEGVWVIDLDHEDHDGLVARPQLPFGHEATGVFARASVVEPLSQILQSMRPDPLTVADDERWAETLAAQANLDPAIKRGLARAFGRSLPATGGDQGGGGTAEVLTDGRVSTIRTLRELLELPGLLTLADRSGRSATRRVRLRVRTSNIDRVDVLADTRPMLSIGVSDGRTTRGLTLVRSVRQLEVLGFRRGA